MKFTDIRRPVEDLVNAFDAGVLLTNSEYQRGESWSEAQKGAFLDSILRGYPVPAIILHKRMFKGLGQSSEKFEIIDGQQRIIALVGFCKRKTFKLPDLKSSKFRVPKSISERPVAWLGKAFDELNEQERERLLKLQLLTIEVSGEDVDDEIRDLFIRLQAGTPLTRQQVRDALPGTIGPFIDGLAGRGKRQPSSKLFSVVDMRGQGTDDDDARDKYVNDRQTCAQLFRLLESSSGFTPHFVSVRAADLDSVYQANTDFDSAGENADRFRELLGDCEGTFDYASDHVKEKKKKKFRRVVVFATFLLFAEMRRNGRARIDNKLYEGVAKAVLQVEISPSGSAVSAESIKSAYEALVGTKIMSTVIERDATRAFSAKQKQEMWERDKGVCQSCHDAVLDGEGEYDHITRYELGGRTEVENGRLVHKRCHQRGRLAER